MACSELRVLADDLTGALDSVAPFAHPDRPLATVWDAPDGHVESSVVAFDAASRELTEAEAVERHHGLGQWLAGGRPAFRKVDSLLRGHVAAELAALARAVPQCRFVIAPAFPHQGRFTREGRQWCFDQSAPVGPDLAADLGARGLDAARGIALHDAETGADLDAIVRREMAASGPVIWVGTAGLAAALARHGGSPSSAGFALAGPMLGLVGSDHPVTRAQVSQSHMDRVALDEEGTGRGDVTAAIRKGRSCLVTIAFEGSRGDASRAISAALTRLLEECLRPGLLFVTGGETLRAVAKALQARALAVEGSLEPGLPVSRLVGGRWDGLAVVSKSGAFGGPDILSTIAGRARAS